MSPFAGPGCLPGEADPTSLPPCHPAPQGAALWGDGSHPGHTDWDDPGCQLRPSSGEDLSATYPGGQEDPAAQGPPPALCPRQQVPAESPHLQEEEAEQSWSPGQGSAWQSKAWGTMVPTAQRGTQRPRQGSQAGTPSLGLAVSSRLPGGPAQCTLLGKLPPPPEPQHPCSPHPHDHTWGGTELTSDFYGPM